MISMRIIVCGCALLLLSGCISTVVGVASDVAVGTVKTAVKIAKAPF